MILTITTCSINDQLNELVKVALWKKQALTENRDSIQQEITDESAKSPDFFRDNKPTEKTEKKYMTARIKSRIFLSTISYVGTNNDFYNENSIFDVYLLVTKNLNPFSLDRKLNDKNKHQMICMLWKEYMPQKFCQHICKENNFFYLNGENVLQPKVSEIVTEFLKEGDQNYIELRNSLSQYKNVFSMFI